MSRRERAANKPASSVSTWYDRYTGWVASSDSSTLNKRWGVMVLGGAALVGIAEVLELGNYPSALIALPAAVAFFLVALGMAHKQHVERGTVPIRARYSHKQRMSRAIVALVVVLALMLFSSAYLPWALGGVVFLTILMGLANLVRMTPEEVEMAKNGVLDPRDQKPTEELEDVIDEETFTWGDSDGVNVTSALESIESDAVYSLVGELMKTCEVRGVEEPNILPAAHGGAVLEWNFPQNSVVAEILPSGEALLTSLDSSFEPADQQEVDVASASQILRFVLQYTKASPQQEVGDKRSRRNRG